MKKMIFILITPIFIFANDIKINNIAPKINTLKNSVKISETIDYDVYDPFLTAKPLLIKEKKVIKKKIKQVIKQNPIIIQTILNNKVLIHNKWYGAGDKVHGIRIKSIRKDAIIVIKNNRWTKINLRKNRNIITTKEATQ